MHWQLDIKLDILDKGVDTVAVGKSAGRTNQGTNAIAIGEKAGYANQAANSIVINATGTEVYNFGASSLVITPVRDAVGTTIMMYDAGTGEVTHSSTIAGSLDGDITGSVFGDDSTVLVDGVNNKIVGTVDTASLTVSSTNVAIGNSAGLTGQNAFAVAIGTSAGLTNQGEEAIAIGYDAGQTGQGEEAIAIGQATGRTNQGSSAVAIGDTAAMTNQSEDAIAIGTVAGFSAQGAAAIAIGENAGRQTQGNNAIAIGMEAAYQPQGIAAIAIGQQAADGNLTISATYVSGGTGGAALVVNDTTGILPGYRIVGTGFTTQTVSAVNDGTTLTISADASVTPSGSIKFVAAQGDRGVAIGYRAGQFNQGNWTVALGDQAGKTNQGSTAIAIGLDSGKTAQGSNAIAIGQEAGGTAQSTYAVAIGYQAGQADQAANALAIGQGAGESNQGEEAIAIGYDAGTINQAANSIVINATGAAVQNTQASSLVIKPIRSAAMTTILGYDAGTGEVTHNAAIPGYISLADLKTEVAASADFAAFKVRIAAL